MPHGRRSPTRRSLVATLLAVTLLLVPVAAGGVPADTGYWQQGTATTAAGTAGTDAAGNATSGSGGPLGMVTGALGAVGSFLFGTTIGNALVGIPLGLYLGLKVIALYLEYYE